jgi:hypothetical protein
MELVCCELGQNIVPRAEIERSARQMANGRRNGRSRFALIPAG